MGRIQTATLVFGGAPGAKTSTEAYDGTSWSNKPSLSQGRDSINGASLGTTTATLGVGGRNGPTFYNNTEEFTAALNIEKITTS